jgi:hypothetical protein
MVQSGHRAAETEFMVQSGNRVVETEFMVQSGHRAGETVPASILQRTTQPLPSGCPSVFGRNLQCEPVRGVNFREECHWSHTCSLQANMRGIQWHPRV